MKKITIFTPTYNRAYILPQLYGSLCRQTCKDFIWLIVDDGSTDDTQTLIKEWVSEGKIEIHSLLQENGGKMRAHNVGVRECKTELFVCLDSDDYFTDNAIELIISKWNESIENQAIVGIISYKRIVRDGNASIIKQFPVKGTCSLHKLYDLGFEGDTTLVFKTDVIRNYPFPEIEGEKFVTEAYVYDQIDKEYKYLLLEKGLTVCQYRDDGYTNNTNKLMMYNPGGWALYFNQLPSYWPKNWLWNYKMRAYSLGYLFRSRQKGLFKLFKSKFRTILSLPLGIRYYYLLTKQFNSKNNGQ